MEQTSYSLRRKHEYRDPLRGFRKITNHEAYVPRVVGMDVMVNHPRTLGTVIDYYWDKGVYYVEYIHSAHPNQKFATPVESIRLLAPAVI